MLPEPVVYLFVIGRWIVIVFRSVDPVVRDVEIYAIIPRFRNPEPVLLERL